MLQAPVTYRNYYSRWIRSFLADLFHIGGRQMLGAFLAILILIFQFHYSRIMHG